MVQAIVYFDETENKFVEKLSEKWDISKAETVKRIIREYSKLVKENGVSNRN